MRIFKDLKNYKGLLVLVFTLTLLNAVAELLLPRFMSLIVDNGIANSNIPYIIQMGLVMLGTSLFAITVRGTASYFSAKAAMGYSKDLRKRIFNKVNHMTFDETEHFGISSLITRATNDVGQIEQLVLMLLRPLMRAPFTFIGGLTMAVLTNARLSIIILLTVPIFAVMVFFVFKVVVPYFPILQGSLDRINLLLRQRLTGLKVIRAFSRDRFEEENFEEANEEYYGLAKKVNQIIETFNPLLALVATLSSVAALFVGTIFISEGQMTIGELMAFVQYVTQVTVALSMATRIMTFLPRASASVNRIDEVVSYPSREVGGSEELKESVSTIEANDLTFYYPGAKVPALDSLNFNAEKGEILGIIGGTGSGKSTLLKLFLQFYNPSEGQLLFNDREIQNLDVYDVREELSYVPQQNYFFSDTVKGNMYYANQTAAEQRMLSSIETAQAREFLSDDYPLEDYVGRGGNNLSGGQRQRLAISRALTREASVYIFDDSFSALDYKTDRELRNALKGKLDEAITIIVAQRVATIRHADKILVLEDGQVQGYGSHNELMEDNQVYREIAISQGEEE